MKTAYIYALSDPISGHVRYIGKSLNPEQRLKTHYRKEETHKSYWIQSLVKKGLNPIMDIIDEVYEDDWQFWEQHWIQLFKSWGFNLVNGDNGGLGPTRLTTDVKNKISKTLTGRRNSFLSKRVAAYKDNGDFFCEFVSFAVAAKCTNSSHGNIVRATKKGKKCAGFNWLTIPEGIFDSKKLEDHALMYKFPKKYTSVTLEVK